MKKTVVLVGVVGGVLAIAVVVAWAGPGHNGSMSFNNGGSMMSPSSAAQPAWMSSGGMAQMMRPATTARTNDDDLQRMTKACLELMKKDGMRGHHDGGNDPADMMDGSMMGQMMSGSMMDNGGR